MFCYHPKYKKIAKQYTDPNLNYYCSRQKILSWSVPIFSGGGGGNKNMLISRPPPGNKLFLISRGGVVLMPAIFK